MDLACYPVAAVMRMDFAVLSPTDPLEAIDPISEEFLATRHLVVLDSKRRVVGVVSLRDLLESSLERLRRHDLDWSGPSPQPMLVADLMSRPVETVGPGEVLAAAANRMISHRIGCLPVVREDGVILGLVTDADLLAAAYREAPSPGSASTSGSPSSSSR